MHNYVSSTQGRASVMDYPPPVVSLNSRGQVDLSNAYTTSIGDWDKVSVNWGYREFPQGADDPSALQRILTEAAGKGLTYLADRDARDPASIHPGAHLWDVGSNAVTGLREVMKVREKALANFGENNIRQGEPMALLEDVLVPVYLFHRYQVEAASKLLADNSTAMPCGETAR
jgi:hypothetical protein